MGQSQSSSPPVCNVKDPQSYQCLQAKMNDKALPAGCDNFQKTCVPCIETAKDDVNATMNCFLRSEDQNSYQKVLCMQKAAAAGGDDDMLVANAGMNCLLSEKDQDILYISAYGHKPSPKQKKKQPTPQQQKQPPKQSSQQ